MAGRLLALLLALGAGLALLDASRARPLAPAQGGALPGSAAPLPAGKRTFRAAIFNMHSGVGTDDVRDLRRTAAQLRDVDFCALNEVRGHLLGRSSDQAQELGQLLGREWLFMPTEHRFWHDHFGNGILSRLPVTAWKRTPLPDNGPSNGYRNITWAKLDLGGGHTVNVLITHINPLAIQATQIRTITDQFCSLQEPALLLADLNADFHQPQVKALLEQPGVHDCLAEVPEVGRKSGRVDWIFARGLKTVGGGRLDNGASDHALFWVDLELAP